MRLKDQIKIDIALLSQALNNGNVTGRYYKTSMWRRNLYTLNSGAMAATKTIVLELLQAKDVNGTDAKAIAGASATITANELVTGLTIDTTAGQVADTITINGLIYTQAAATDATKREFQNAAGLVTCVSHPTYGVEGIKASANGAVVTLISTEPGENTITASTSANHVIATTQAQAYVELDISQLDIANDFCYVAARVTTTANSNIAVGLIRGEGRYSPDQVVGAYAVV